MVDINLPPSQTSSSTGSDQTITPYSGGQFQVSTNGTIDQSQLPDMTMKPITSGDGGTVSVDTSSLKTFADNLDVIADAVGKVWTRLNQLEPVRAGGTQFVEAQALASTTTGSGGLQQNYLSSLDALQSALMNTSDQIRTLAGKYSSIDEMTQKAGTDLANLINQAGTEVQQFESDVQTTEQSAGGGSGPAPVSSGAATTTGATTTTGSTATGSTTSP